jgi:hypothetical protein
VILPVEGDRLYNIVSKADKLSARKWQIPTGEQLPSDEKSRAMKNP